MLVGVIVLCSCATLYFTVPLSAQEYMTLYMSYVAILLVDFRLHPTQSGISSVSVTQLGPSVALISFTSSLKPPKLLDNWEEHFHFQSQASK